MALLAPDGGFQPLTLRRFLDAAWARRFPIAAFVLVIAILTAVLAWFTKPWWTAEATLLPPTEGGDMFSNLSGLIESSALSKVGLLSTTTPSGMYIEVLRSRRLRESLVRKFDLTRRYDIKGMDNTLKELDLHLSIHDSPAGVVAIRVEDTDPQRAADMANYLVGELDRFNREILNTRGKRTRQFLETRLAEVSEKMRAAEVAMTAYEQKNKVVLSGEESSVRGLADVMSQKLSLQVRRAYVGSYTAPGSPVTREIDAELEAFDRELSGLPLVKNEGARLLLDATIQRKLFTLVTAQYEEARVQEMRDTPTVTILDEARAPEIRTRPRRTLMVAIATLFAFAASMAWVWFSMRRTARA